MSYVADYSAPTYGTVAHPLSSVYVLGSPLSSTVVWEVGGAPAGSRGHVPIELSVLFLREGVWRLYALRTSGRTLALLVYLL